MKWSRRHKGRRYEMSRRYEWSRRHKGRPYNRVDVIKVDVL